MGKRTSVSAPLVIAGLVAFILVDLALVFFALRPPAQAGRGAMAPTPTLTSLPNVTTTPTTAPSSQATPDPMPTPAETVSPTGETAPTAVPSSTATTLQGFADSQVGYRATAGSCDGADSVVERTTDGGSTWTNVNPSDIRIRQVESIVVVDGDHVDLLARYGDSCTLSDVSTYTQGQFWQVYPDKTAQLQNQ